MPALDRDVQLPAELADIGDAERDDRAPAMAIARTWPKGKAGVGDIGVGDGGEDVAGARPHQRQRAVVLGDVGERASSPAGMFCAIQAKSWVAKPVPVTM